MAQDDGGGILRAARDHLGPAEAAVADALLAAGSEAFTLSIADIARLAGTSQASVVRLGKKLGYRGFRDLRLDLIRTSATGAGMTVFDEIESTDSVDVIADKVANRATAAINEGRQLLDSRAVAAAVTALERAHRIDVYGIGASGVVAVGTAFMLRRLGLASSSYPDSHQQTQSASLLTDRDVALAFSHSGATLDVVRAAEIAQSAGATVIAVTSFPLSKLAKVADCVLLAGAVSEPTERSGSTLARIAQLYVADVLTVAYSHRHYAETQAALQKSSAAVKDLRLS